MAGNLLEIGGLQFPASPFNGWYNSIEIVRNFLEEPRYNLLQVQQYFKVHFKFYRTILQFLVLNYIFLVLNYFSLNPSSKILGAEMGLDTSTNISLWKDKVSVEMNYAILHSFQKAGVSIVDQFSASEQFQEHFNNEVRERGGCPADWVWLTPSLSGSLTTLWHQEMLHYHLTPSYERQELMWQNYRYVNIAPHSQDENISQGRIIHSMNICPIF